jgi:hypothetical protein
MTIFDADFSNQDSTLADHVWMDRMVHEIRDHLPRMLQQHPQRDEFWDWFCGETDSLFRYVHRDEDLLYFQDFINKTLEDAGLEERFDLTRRVDNPACAHASAATGQRPPSTNRTVEAP